MANLPMLVPPNFCTTQGASPAFSTPPKPSAGVTESIATENVEIESSLGGGIGDKILPEDQGLSEAVSATALQGGPDCVIDPEIGLEARELFVSDYVCSVYISAACTPEAR